MEAIFKALGDKNRVKLIEYIKEHPNCCACELLKLLDVSQPTLSHHMKQLQQVGLVKADKQGQFMHYCIDEKLFIKLQEFFKV